MDREIAPSDGDAAAVGPSGEADATAKAQILWGQGFLWDADDAIALRERHKIVGKAVGALPGFPQQNENHGLPVQILPEAVLYLRRKGLLELEPTPIPEPHDAAASAVSDVAAKLTTHERIRLPFLPDDPSPSGVAPADAAEKVADPPCVAGHAAVFASLSDQRYAITEGGKFAADYLAYNDDPDKVHAMFTVKVCGWDEAIDPLKIVAASRVSHGARKHLLLAAVGGPQGEGEGDKGEDGGGGKVRYITLSPEGGFTNALTNEAVQM